MNPVTITEEIIRAIDVSNPDVNRHAVPAFQEATKGYPLLTYDFGDGSDLQTAAEKATFDRAAELFRTPFQNFRFHVTSSFGTYFGVCLNLGRCIYITAVISNPDWARRDDKLILKVFLHQPKRPGIADWNTRLFWHNNGKEITRKNELLPPEKQRTVDKIVTASLLAVEILSQEYLAPGTTVARVTPDRPAKSVQWLRAREHYTIVHHRHAANDKTIAHGAIVNQNQATEIKRLAHRRRAHDRLLKSVRFKRDANGNIRKIPVAAAWVGPEEWKDTAGQIYKVVKLNN